MNRRARMPTKIWRSWTVAHGRRYERWVFTDPRTGKRVRRSSLAAARAERSKAMRLLMGRGVELVGSAAEEYGRWRDGALLAGGSLDEIFRAGLEAFSKRRDAAQGLGRVSLSEALARFVAARKSDGAQGKHVADLEQRLGRFVREAPGEVRLLSVPLCNEWLRGLKVGARSRVNYSRVLRNFCGWLEGERLLPSDFRIKDLARPKAARGEIEIFTPQEMSLLLESAGASVLPVLLLGGFAGLRTESEVPKVHWDMIDFEEGWITVPEDTKTGRRLAPLAANLRAWLEPRRGKGPVLGIGANGVSKALARTVARANGALGREHSRWSLRWRHNALRHSYVSYRCALVGDLGKVSKETGHSVAELQKSYLRIVTPNQAKAWFAIFPGSAHVSLFQWAEGREGGEGGEVARPQRGPTARTMG